MSSPSGSARLARVCALLLVWIASACGPARPEARAGSDPPPPSGAPPRPPQFATDDAAVGRFHSKRFQLSFPLPDGKTWKIDDHSKPELVATHGPTSSRVVVVTTNEDELMNRARCEKRARELGHVPASDLTTVENEVMIHPEAYDSRVWVALDAGRPGGGVDGHVFLFGSFLRRCLIVHVSTTVPNAKYVDVLSSRLAIVRGQVIRGLKMDPLRTTDDATVPRDRPEIRR
jgi:hypothetical protein